MTLFAEGATIAPIIARWAAEKALSVKQTYFNGKLTVHAADEH
jgi:hypothetical protein